ncbi:MAG: hypothetical protein OK442_01690 [Thaumarchaeota archaeon]|nr:hypothetical protein [Nitrososphaerota archaeon]
MPAKSTIGGTVGGSTPVSDNPFAAQDTEIEDATVSGISPYLSSSPLGTGTDTVGVGGMSNALPGVLGSSGSGYGVEGVSEHGDGLYGSSVYGNGVHGAGKNAGLFDGEVTVNGNEAISGSLTAGSAKFSGVTTTSLAASGALTAGSLETSGSLSAGSLKASGALTAGSLETSGALTAGSVTTSGKVTAYDVVLTGGGDIAEEFAQLGEESEPGTVMVIGDEGGLSKCTLEYDRRVAGVVSSAANLKPAIVLKGAERALRKGVSLAMVGRVYCKADASYGPIRVGDLLTTSPTGGHAMAAMDPARAFGSVLGKALANLERGTGLIPILIALQ